MPSLWSVVFGVLATLIATGIVAFLRKRQLHLAVSSHFPYSNLTDKGTIVELSLINRGYRTEEDIEIVLDRQLRFEIVASTASSVTLERDTLRVARISANDQINTILLVDGGTFSPSEIRSVSSGTTKGKVFDGLEKVPPNTGVNILAFLLFAALLGFGFFGGYEIGIQIGRQQEESAQFAAESAETQAEIATLNASIGHDRKISEEDLARMAKLKESGWRGVEEFFKSRLADAYPEGLPVNITEVKRRGKVVEVTVTLHNATNELLRISGKLISPVGDSGDIDLWDRSFYDAVVIEHADLQQHLKAFLPPNYPRQVLIADFNVQGAGDYISLHKRIELWKAKP